MYTTLISAANLASHREDKNWVVLDCRHDLMDHQAGQVAYDGGHIPGAHFVNLELTLSAAKKFGADGKFLGRHPLPEKTDFITSLRRLGVNDDTQVVAYDAQGGMYAARLWWMLRWIGHPAVAVLDGGLPAWQALQLPLTAAVPVPGNGNIDIKPALVTSVDVNQVLANISSAEKTVVDARAADRFRGENEIIDPVGGHIPGAKNRFFKDNLQADSRFKPAAQLRQEWSAVISDPTLAIMQCGSGATACHNLLALEVAGMHGAALYPGSWSEWCADSSRPMEK